MPIVLSQHKDKCVLISGMKEWLLVCVRVCLCPRVCVYACLSKPPAYAPPSPDLTSQDKHAGWDQGTWSPFPCWFNGLVIFWQEARQKADGLVIKNNEQQLAGLFA